jgi:hypothetical protein
MLFNRYTYKHSEIDFLFIQIAFYRCKPGVYILYTNINSTRMTIMNKSFLFLICFIATLVFNGDCRHGGPPHWSRPTMPSTTNDQESPELDTAPTDSDKSSPTPLRPIIERRFKHRTTTTLIPLLIID